MKGFGKKTIFFSLSLSLFQQSLFIFVCYLHGHHVIDLITLICVSSHQLESAGKGSALVIDVLKYDMAIQKAVLYAVGNTVVCETYEEARRLAFAKTNPLKGIPVPPTPQSVQFEFASHPLLLTCMTCFFFYFNMILSRFSSILL